ncbi:MAG TPA: hypothetical protein VM573_07735 [Actinomycetota bacterium]|nr:hypothetical protein [Actinomycetota bacterium]
MFEVVFVCTGNRCRSPVGEASLREVAPEWVRVSSCGTLDLAAATSPSETLRAAAGLGLDLSTHRSRHLGVAKLPDADLVVGFELAHVAAAVVEGGADPAKTFTLPELIRLLGSHRPEEYPAEDPEARARRLVATAAKAKQGFVPQEEIADPIGSRQQVHDRISGQIRELAHELARTLFQPPDAGGQEKR